MENGWSRALSFVLFKDLLKLKGILAGRKNEPVTLLDVQLEGTFDSKAPVAVGAFHILLFLINCKDMTDYISPITNPSPQIWHG